MKSSSHLLLSAPAKINIFLKILGKRADGYHEIISWMQKLTLYDTITLHRISSGISLQCSSPDVPLDQNNLVCKAAQYFFQETSLQGGVDIVLEKRIPVAAGLGGGSSDAAAVLKGLNVLYDAGLSVDEMMRMGKALGADVPFFVSDYPSAWAAGIGEKLEKNECMPDYWIILVNPGFSVSTKWVYHNFALTSAVNPDTLTRFTEVFDAPFEKRGALLTSALDMLLDGQSKMNGFSRHFWPATLYNDLEKVTSSRYPEISEMKERLLQAGACGALMSGSGPTVFAVFDNELHAVDCQESLNPDYPGNVFLVKPIRN